jgi:hypothetical protein
MAITSLSVLVAACQRLRVRVRLRLLRPLLPWL